MAPRRRAPKGETTVVKTTLLLPEAIWRAARIRALDERTNLKEVVVNALTAYLKTAVKEKR